MATKYYVAMNAAGRLIGGEKFEIVEIVAGTAIGVFAATTDAQIAALDAAVAAKTGVSEITQAEYDEYIQKKTPSFNSFPHSNNSRSEPQVSLNPRAGVVVAEPGLSTPPSDALDSVEAALQNVGKVQVAPEPEPEKPAKKNK